MHRAAVDKKLLIDCTAVLRDTRRVSIVDRGGGGGRTHLLLASVI